MDSENSVESEIVGHLTCIVRVCTWYETSHSLYLGIELCYMTISGLYITYVLCRWTASHIYHKEPIQPNERARQCCTCPEKNLHVR